MQLRNFVSGSASLSTGVYKFQILRYKLYIMVIQIDVPCDVLFDNLTLVTNSYNQDENITNKHNTINFHIIYDLMKAYWVRVDF